MDMEGGVCVCVLLEVSVYIHLYIYIYTGKSVCIDVMSL